MLSGLMLTQVIFVFNWKYISFWETQTGKFYALEKWYIPFFPALFRYIVYSFYQLLQIHTSLKRPSQKVCEFVGAFVAIHITVELWADAQSGSSFTYEINQSLLAEKVIKFVVT